MGNLGLRRRSARRCAEDNNLFPKLTARSQAAMTLAHQEALRRGDDYIGTEHLLLGLLGEGEGIAATVLGSCGIELGQARAAVDRIVGRRANPVMEKRELSLMPRMKKVLDLADQEARHLRQRYIGTEHLLLGLLREGEGVAADILRGHGVTFERARESVLMQLASVGHSAEPDAEPEASTVVMCRLDARSVDALDALIEAGVRTTRWPGWSRPASRRTPRSSRPCRRRSRRFADCGCRPKPRHSARWRARVSISLPEQGKPE